MDRAIVAMILVFMSILPWAFVRAYLPPRQQRFLNRMQRGFMFSCLILLAPPATESGIFAAAVGITVVAYLLGGFASAGLLWLLSAGELPTARTEPAAPDEWEDVLYDWSRRARIYRLKCLVAYACGFAAAAVARLCLL